MAIPAMLLPILGQLAGNGLQIVSDAVQARGKKEIEERLGIELKPDMSQEELAKVQVAAMEHERELKKIVEQEITKRHTADMTSDSWLSKNIRPMSLVYLMALFSAAFVVDVPLTVLEMLRDLLMTVFVFYFGSRSIEKGLKIFKEKT